MREKVDNLYKETLKEWCSNYHTDNEFLKMFFTMDNTMKYIHNNGYYITNFNPKNIIVGITSNDENYVIFNNLDLMDEDVTNKINNNIYNLAFLEIGLLSETLDYLRPDFLKANFSQFKVFIPDNLVDYYKRVLVNQGHFYLTDYLETKNKKEMAKLSKSLDDENKGSSQGHSYVKTTGHYSKEDNNLMELALPQKKDNDIAAFVTNYALAFVIIASSLLIPIIAFLLGQR